MAKRSVKDLGEKVGLGEVEVSKIRGDRPGVGRTELVKGA